MMAWLSFALGLGGLSIHVLAVLAGLRLFRTSDRVLIHLVSACLAETMFVVAGLLAGPDVPFWHGSAVIGCGAIGYLFAFSAVYKSVSLRMLLELVAVEGGSVHPDKISMNIVRGGFADRIRVLVEMGYVVKEDGDYTLAEGGRRFVERFKRLQSFFGIDESGFYG